MTKIYCDIADIAFLILFTMIILLKFFFFTFIKTPLVLSTLTLGPPKLKHMIGNEYDIASLTTDPPVS